MRDLICYRIVLLSGATEDGLGLFTPSLSPPCSLVASFMSRPVAPLLSTRQVTLLSHSQIPLLFSLSLSYFSVLPACPLTTISSLSSPSQTNRFAPRSRARIGEKRRNDLSLSIPFPIPTQFTFIIRQTMNEKSLSQKKYVAQGIRSH